MGIGDLAEGLTRGAERFGDGVSQALEPVVRLGVTGLSRAGKTVFITSLVANLLDRGRMPQFMPAANGAIIAAYLQPQPDDTVPRFDYESHLAALTGENPHWPESTRAVSELRLSLLVRPTGILKSLVRPRRLHLDIVDYPGEWLLDLALLHKTYAQWSADMLERIRNRALAQPFLAQAAKLQSVARFEESQAQDLARRYTGYLRDARDAGLSDCTPGRFLLPGELRGAPVLTFAPLNRPERPARASLWREMERRYDAYRKQVVKPFFRNHFARIDRQVVLVDALGAIHDGPEAVADMNRAMADILAAFRPGHNGRLSRLL
ncbi:MAG: YcjX family protein, partial [Halocynthiibacter sp.]